MLGEKSHGSVSVRHTRVPPTRITRALLREYEKPRSRALVRGSYRCSLRVPVSTTCTMSLMVMDVSAMFVARTILRWPDGGRWNTACCSDTGRLECTVGGDDAELDSGRLQPLDDQSFVTSQ